MTSLEWVMITREEYEKMKWIQRPMCHFIIVDNETIERFSKPFTAENIKPMTAEKVAEIVRQEMKKIFEGMA